MAMSGRCEQFTKTDPGNKHAIIFVFQGFSTAVTGATYWSCWFRHVSRVLMMEREGS